MTTIEPTPWRNAVATFHDPQLTAVLVVQCDLAWLRPAAAVLRDEIDEALAALTVTRKSIRIDRIVLHNLPAISDVPSQELAALNPACPARQVRGGQRKGRPCRRTLPRDGSADHTDDHACRQDKASDTT
jgi:hypothetical protein